MCHGLHAIFSRFCTAKLIVGRLSHLCVRRVGSAHPGAPHVEARVLCILRFYTKQLQVPVKKYLLYLMCTLSPPVVKYARETCILLYRHTALQAYSFTGA